METGYTAVLQSMPEPLRSQMLYGDFQAGMQDHEWQVIPSEWVRLAQKRWQDAMASKPAGTAKDWRPAGAEKLDCLGADIARGGEAKTVLSRRYGKWFAPLEKHPGRHTPDGPAAARLIAHAVSENQRAVVNLDIIGIGAAVFDTLRLQTKLPNIVNVNFAEHTGRRDRTGVFHFLNIRAYAYWTLREALDPDKGDGLMLPPDPEMVADLCAARYSVEPGGIRIELKEEIVKRIGRSPDCGDAVVLAAFAKKMAVNIG
jgi:hypothetical protein